MGDLSTVTGEIRITPPLTAAELRCMLGGPDFGAVVVQVDRVDRETDEGTLVVTTGVALEPAEEGEFTVRDFATDVQGAVATLAEIGGHRLDGVMVREGARQGDVERVVVADSVCTVETAVLAWPDGSAVDVRW